MKAEEQIDQKQLLKMIKVLNDQYKTKIKTKGSITDLAEAFADGVETLSGKAPPCQKRWWISSTICSQMRPRATNRWMLTIPSLSRSQ